MFPLTQPLQIYALFITKAKIRTIYRKNILLIKSYIHLFKTNQEFTEAFNSPNYEEPWLSLTEENNAINYSKTPPKVLTAITFENLTWVTDIPVTGGTATKDNCSYTIMARYIGSEPEDITSQVTVKGRLIVAETTATTRQSVGTLILTAEYKGISCTGSVVAYQKKAVDLKEPLTFKISSPGTINWKAIEDSPKTIEYKLNDGGWISITSNTGASGASVPSITVNASDKIQFRGDNATYGVYEKYTTFSGSTAGFEVEGNIMSLINSTNFSTLTTLQNIYTFYKLFEGCTGLTSAENLILPATTLAGNCYRFMFANCSKLTTVPSDYLPANTLAIDCYSYMFADCTSLTTAPALPATTLEPYCYQYMFYNCTSLVTAPALPATTLAESCYQDMFYNCTSLTTAPELPATTLVDGCYQYMFESCSSLTTAPELPATTLVDGCYQYMFYNCASLNYIKCLATDISATDCTNRWVDGVAANGTFAKSPDMSGWTTGENGIPTGWTVINAT